MTYKIKAHPTEYRGTMFRSRLEATWAAFFDQLGWAWDYEPIDMVGWVPDFVIRGKYREVFIEVKPTKEMALAALPKALAAAPGACVAVVADGLWDRGGEISDLLCREIGVISTPYTRLNIGARPWWVSENSVRRLFDTHVDGEPFLGFYSGLNTEHHVAGEDGDIWTPFVNLSPQWAAATNLTRWRPA